MHVIYNMEEGEMTLRITLVPRSIDKGINTGLVLDKEDRGNLHGTVEIS